MRPAAWLALAVLAAPTLLAREPSPEALRRRIDAILSRAAFAPAFWGVEVRSARTGRVLYAHAAGKNFKPASTLKLLTTAAALDVLGPDERLQTSVETSGRLDGLGRILGDVYLVGRGDPQLSGRNGARATAAFESLADALVAAGVRRIEGRLVGHEGLFEGERRGADWSWEDLVWSYGAEVSALSFGENVVSLTVAPGERAGDALVVEAEPVSSYYRVVSTATTAAAGTTAELALARDAGSNTIRITGSLALGDRPWQGAVALEDPARYAASVFAEVLAARGIRVSGGVATSSDPLPAGTRVLAAHASPPISELIKATNKDSLNLHAEMLLRLLGARVKGRGSAAAGHEALADFLRKLGLDPSPWALQDGSGLSRSDILAPSGLAALLVAMERHPHARAFRDSLPVAGVDGTLKARMNGTPAEGRILAKTGTLRHANALAGYAERGRDERLAFAIVVNHHTVPGSEAVAAIDAICRALLAP